MVTLPRTFGGAFTNLIIAQIRNGRVAALDSTAAAYRARFPDSKDLWEIDWYAAWGQGRPDRADSISRAVFAQARTARQSIRSAGATAAVAYMHGRLAEGLRWGTQRDEAQMRANPSAASRLAFALDTAFHALQAGDPAGGRAAVQRGLARHPTDSMPPDERPWENLSWLAAGLGDAPLARLALAGYERDLASTSVAPVGQRAFYAADVALAEQQWDEAVGLLHEADARLGIDERYAMSQLGRAHDQAGRSDSAVVYYEKFVTTPGPVPDRRRVARGRRSTGGWASCTRRPASPGRRWSTTGGSWSCGRRRTRRCSRRWRR